MALGLFEQLAWLTTRVKRLCCAVEQIQQSGAGSSYKVYTAYYNVEENILDVYENTLGEIEFSATSPTILAITSNSLFGDISGSGSPEKAYITITNSTGAFVDFATDLVNSSTIQIVSSVNMFNESVKFFIEIRVYN
jgi:hypothetical protein